MSLNSIFDDPQPRDLRIVHFQRAAIKTFGELQNLTRIHKADSFKPNQIHNTIATNLTPGNPLVNQKLTFSSPIPNKSKPTQVLTPALSNKKHSQVSAFLKERLAQREMMEESTHSLTRRYLSGKEPNALERRYIAASNTECGRNAIQDPYSRMIMFYKYLIFHFGEKRVEILKKFFSTNRQALGVRFRILDVQNDGYISAEEMRNICLQFATNINRDAINEIVDFVKEKDMIYYKCFLLTPSCLANRMLYGEDSRIKLGSLNQLTDSPMTGDEIIRRKRDEFERLVALCKERNIVLSKCKLERALLLPENRTMDDIFQHFTGISLTRPSSKPGYQYGDGNSSESESELGEPNTIRTYLSNRKPIKKKVILSTGKVTLSSKVDCWLNFRDYLKLTTFSKRYTDLHYGTRGPLPDCTRYLTEPNAFWTGSNENIHPYIPYKERSLNPTNVHFKRIDRHFAVTTDRGSKHGKNSWPINKAGYMQYGSLPDKQCIL